MRHYRNYTNEQLFEAVKSSKSIAGTLKTLGLKAAGGNYAHLKSNLQKFNLDTSHWKGQGWSKGHQLKDWSQYSKISSIKPHLTEERGHQCEECGMKRWGEEKIPLEVHHMDGDRTNNKYENLKLLCCNCHALTDNWRNKKKTK